MSNIGFATKAYRRLLRMMPFKLALYLIYYRGYGKILNLKNPKTWGEKIQWLKLFGGLEELSTYVDKYEVREYVKEKIGESFLNNIYGVYDDVNQISFESLPEKFVLKSTNGSGAVIVCNDKTTFDVKQAKKEMKKWLKDRYHREKKELQYKNIKNRIIIEEYLENKNGSLTDYKFYCFNGKVEYYAIFYDRYFNKSIDVYDINNRKLEGVKVRDIQNSDNSIDDLDSINEMRELSEKLSSIFSCVRVDFYCVNGKPIFGELTFTDGAGSDKWTPEDFDIEIASRIPMEKILKRMEKED